MIDQIVSYFTSVFTKFASDLYIGNLSKTLKLLVECYVRALEGGNVQTKLGAIEFLSKIVPSLHSSRSSSHSPHSAMDIPFLRLFSDIFLFIDAIDESNDFQVSDEMQTKIYKSICNFLKVVEKSHILDDACNKVTRSKVCGICIDYYSTKAKSRPERQMNGRIFQIVVKLIVNFAANNSALLTRIVDLLEDLLKNQVVLKFDENSDNFRPYLESLTLLLSLFHNGSEKISLMTIFEEKDFTTIFQSKGDSPSIPAKRQKTGSHDENSTGKINAKSFIETCNSNNKLIGLIVKILTSKIDHPHHAFVVAGVLFSEISFSLSDDKVELVPFYSHLSKHVLALLMSLTNYQSSMMNTEATFYFAGFFRHSMALTWPDRFFDSNQMIIASGIISLPWLQIHSSSGFADLRLPPSLSRTLLQSSSKFQYELFQLISIEVLALLPKEVCPQWRCSVFKSFLLEKSTKKELIVNTLNYFSVLLHILGPSSNSMVYEALHEMVKKTNEDVEVLQSLSANLGNLACVISRKSTLVRSHGSVDISCECQLIGDKAQLRLEEEKKSASSRAVDSAMFIPLTAKLSQVENTQVKINFAKSVKQLFSHLSFTHDNSIVLFEQYCLKLLGDDNSTVRLNFASSLLSIEDVSEKLREVVVSYVEQLEEKAFSSVQTLSNLRAISNMIMNSKDNVFSSLLAFMVKRSLAKLSENTVANRFSGACAEMFLSDAILHRNSERPFMTFVECSSELSELLSTCLLAITANGQKAANGDRSRARRRGIVGCHHLLDSLCRMFKFCDRDRCLSIILPTVLPRLVISGSCEMQLKLSTLELVTDMMSTTPKHLIIDNVISIWSYVLCHASTTEAIENANSVVKEVTKQNLDDLVARDSQKACFFLASKLGSNAKQAIKALRFLAEHDQQGGQKIGESQFVEFLSQRLLGILLFLDTQFNSQWVSQNDKLNQVVSLVQLLQIMGANNVNTVCVKLLATLRIILKLKTRKILESALKAWALFVKFLEPDNLTQLLPQILVSLLPLAKMFPGYVDGIFENVFSPHRLTTIVQKCIDDISFIVVDCPELVRHLKTVPKFEEIKRSPKAFVAACSRGCANESSEVRLMALNRLKTYLTGNQSSLVASISSNQLEYEWGPAISQLLRCCHDADINVR